MATEEVQRCRFGAVRCHELMSEEDTHLDPEGNIFKARYTTDPEKFVTWMMDYDPAKPLIVDTEWAQAYRTKQPDNGSDYNKERKMTMSAVTMC